MTSIPTNRHVLQIHPDDYGPIQALDRQRPTQEEPHQVTIMVRVSEPLVGSQEWALPFHWRDDIHCWHSVYPLCIKA